MKQRGRIKKLSVVLLATAMVIAAFPQFSMSVFAQERTNELPTVEQFATVEELKSFNTISSDANPDAKVYFGLEPGKDSMQPWWIAGSQNGNITLFAFHPMKTGVKFVESVDEKPYEDDWNCEYPEGVTVSRVYANYYGASNARKVLRDIEGTYFTGTEKALMNTTTVYTNDEYYQDKVIGDTTPNNTTYDSIYSTKEKLYLPYGHLTDNKYITVGNNKPNNNIKTLNELNSGLQVDPEYWNNWNCWLRTPVYDDINKADWSLFASPKSDGKVKATGADNPCALAPAFELNLSLPQAQVIFASGAVAVTQNGKVTVQDTDGNGAFTLRYKADDLGAAEVSYDKSKVTLTDVSTDKDVYLVVQNKNGAYAKKVSGNMTIDSNQIDSSLTSLENCKVWLETNNTADRIIYATLATEEQPSYDVELSSDIAFGSQHIGYSDVSAQTVEIENTGNANITNLNAVLTGTGKDEFTLDTSKMQTTLSPQGETTVTVKPIADLAAGEHTAQLLITGETGVSETLSISFTVEGHEYKEEWKSSETGHWQECDCGAKSEKTAHTFKWVVDKEPTEKEKGFKHEECSVCEYKKASVEIPVITPADTEKPNTDKHGNDSPETDDQRNVGLFASMFVMSVLGIAVLAIWRKKRTL